MLVLGRNLNDTIVIDGKIFIKIVRGELFPGIEKMEEKWAKALKK